MSTRYQAVVRNELEQNIQAYIKFIVPLGEYIVDHGEIIMIREDGEQAEIYVVAPVDQMSELTVTLSECF
jgi:hypothetical protein